MFTGITTILPVFLRHAGGAELARLSRAVESVLTQDRGLPLELLVVDDGSEPAVRLPERSGLRIVRLPRNYGISYALNAGLTQASHNLIARIDADDFWRPGKLARQLRLMQEDGDLTLAASSMRLVHQGNPKLDRDEMRGGDWDGVLALTQRIGCPFPHGSILARREVFDTLGGYPQDAIFQHSEDFALWAQWIRFFKVAICDEVFLEYTVAEGQISSRFVEEQQRASEAAQRVLGSPEKLLAPMQVVAQALGLSLIETSIALFTAWRFYEHILVDEELYDAAATLLPDRAVHREEDVNQLLAERFFHLTKQKRTASLRGRFR